MISSLETISESNTTYEESEADILLRELFEQSPFQTSKLIMDQVLRPNIQFPILTKLTLKNETSITQLENHYSNLYAILFQTTPKQNNNNKISNTSHIIEPNIQNTKKRSNFKINLAYQGSAFQGYQIQKPNSTTLPTIQETLIRILDPILNSSFRKKKPIAVCCCGKTDSGVSAISQVIRVRTYQQHITCDTIRNRIHQSSFGRDRNFKCLSVQNVSDQFHPSFGANYRAYAYFIDVVVVVDSGVIVLTPNHVSKLDQMLQTLVNQTLDYYAFSYGKIHTETTLCTLYLAQASLVQIQSQRGICIQLVGDRFLRRMVRKLVGTAMREVLKGDDWDRECLLKISEQGKRELCAKAAPPDGLIFVGAEFENE